VSIWAFQRFHGEPAPGGRAGKCAFLRSAGGCGALWPGMGWRAGKLLAMLALRPWLLCPARHKRQQRMPKRRPLRQRSRGGPISSAGGSGRAVPGPARLAAKLGKWWESNLGGGRTFSPACADGLDRSAGSGAGGIGGNRDLATAWPTAVLSQSFGLVTGRISALALDPSDATGNTLYVGTTGGGSGGRRMRTHPVQPHQFHTPYRRLVGPERRGGLLHQHWRAHRAAGRNRRDSGRHRRPQRRPRFLLRRGNSALR